jgi:hypothetical protein
MREGIYNGSKEKGRKESGQRQLVDVPFMTPPTKRWKGVNTDIQKPKRKKGK